MLSIVVLTYNEQQNLPACLSSLTPLQASVFIVDSGSSDGTQQIAEQFGATVTTHPFRTHTAQWSWALRNLPLNTPWVLALDADQQATPELVNELRNLDSPSFSNVSGAFVARRQIFRGRWIRHGGYYPKYLLKLFRPQKVRLNPADLVDHHFAVDGPTIRLEGDIIEANVKEDDMSFWIDKHNRYASLLAREELEWQRTGQRPSIGDLFKNNPDDRVAVLKSIWRRMPLYIRPFLYFFHRYFIRLGFLDGKQGAIFHFMQAFWFRLLVDIKLDDLRRDRDPI